MIDSGAFVHSCTRFAHTKVPFVNPFATARARRGGAAWMRRLLQPEQDTPEPWHQIGGQSRRIVPLVQRPQSLVPDSSYATVARRVTRRKRLYGPPRVIL